MFTRKPDRPVGAASAVEPPRPMAPTPTPPASSAGAFTSWPATTMKGTDKMSPSVIGADLTVTGNLQSKGEVTVEGEIQGDIHCASLLVGETAQITGGIVAEDVVVRGKVLGSIRGNRVTLQSNSHVEGDVFHKSLAIEQGAFFEGKSRRLILPLESIC